MGTRAVLTFIAIYEQDEFPCHLTLGCCIVNAKSINQFIYLFALLLKARLVRIITILFLTIDANGATSKVIRLHEQPGEIMQPNTICGDCTYNSIQSK